jgi:hypothetical protein
MRKKAFLIAVLLLLFTLTAPVQLASADTLSPNDFKLQSFGKTVDFFDYARAYAESSGKQAPPAYSHAYLYQVYVNSSGFQLFFSGLSNITDEQKAVTTPVQSFIEHYKTPGGKDVLTSSSFLMLLAFNDTSTSLYQDSPDKNDDLYASFSTGVDLTNVFGNHTSPSLSSKTTIIPLTSSDDKLTWQWGMKYANLTAIWWKISTDSSNPNFEKSTLVAITTYQELTFTYNLAINPTDHTAKLTANYVIGRMTNLWLISWLLIPIVVHYNSTGAYLLNGLKISDETIYQYLGRQHIKMSIVLFQNSLVLDGTTKSTFNNQNVTDANVNVSSGSISTTSGNEEVFKTDFGTKQQYKLYNYTYDSSENTYKGYDAVTRTAMRNGLAKNPIFGLQVALLKYVPLIIANIDPPLYQQAKDHMLNMTYADCFYIISYPAYSGFKVQHDPTYTASIAATAPTTAFPTIASSGLLIVGAAAVAVGAIFALKKRTPKTLAVR